MHYDNLAIAGMFIQSVVQLLIETGFKKGPEGN